MLKKIYFIYLFAFIFLFMFLLCESQAITPPDGCVADSYLTYDNGSGSIIADYYQGNIYSCSQALSKNYLGITIENAPLSSIFDDTVFQELTEKIDSFQLNLSSIISFFAGVLSICAFVMGVNGGRMS